MKPTVAAQPLALGIVQPDKEGIEELLSKYSPAMYRAALRKLRNPEDAEDALQDALLSASRNLGQFKGECHISTWLIAIAINSARMQLRRRLHMRHVSLDQSSDDETQFFIPEIADARPDPEQVYRRAELRGIISEASTRLSPSLRNAFRLRVLEGFSIREAALALGVAEGTLKAQFFRARTHINWLMRKSLGLPRQGKYRGQGRRQNVSPERPRDRMASRSSDSGQGCLDPLSAF
jgi:RNA polymerase sigma-70 factor (ECF subfamily)